MQLKNTDAYEKNVQKNEFSYLLRKKNSEHEVNT